MSTSLLSATDTAAQAAAVQSPAAAVSPDNVRHCATLRELFDVLAPDALYEMERAGYMRSPLLTPDDKCAIHQALEKPPNEMFAAALPILAGNGDADYKYLQFHLLTIGHVLNEYERIAHRLLPHQRERITRIIENVPPDIRQQCIEIIAQQEAQPSRVSARPPTCGSIIVVKERINKTSDQIRSDQIDVVKSLDQNGDQNSGTATADDWPASYHGLNDADKATAQEALRMLPGKLAKLNIPQPQPGAMMLAVSQAVNQNASKQWQGIRNAAAASAGLAASMIREGKVYQEPIEPPAQPASKPAAYKQPASNTAASHRTVMVCRKCQMESQDCLCAELYGEARTALKWKEENHIPAKLTGDLCEMDNAQAIPAYFHRCAKGKV